MTLDIQNLAYAITQIVHNFGAVSVVSGAVFALGWREREQQRRLAWIVLAGWLVQAVSGATFGAISYYYYAKFPDLFGIAVVALIVKVICAVFGFTLAGWQLIAHHSEVSRRYAWYILCGLGILALSSAAVLRWFS
jgi:ABC-type xylose transport system permease subunit